jgi:hypothetical protein
MNLKFFINKEGKKIYTLRESVDNQPTKEAHYKFIKFNKKFKETKQSNS